MFVFSIVNIFLTYIVSMALMKLCFQKIPSKPLNHDVALNDEFKIRRCKLIRIYGSAYIVFTIFLWFFFKLPDPWLNMIIKVEESRMNIYGYFAIYPFVLIAKDLINRDSTILKNFLYTFIYFIYVSYVFTSFNGSLGKVVASLFLLLLSFIFAVRIFIYEAYERHENEALVWNRNY